MKQKATKDSVLAAVRGILAGGVVSFSTDDVVSITKGSKATVLRLIHENAEAIEQMKTEGISLPVSIRDDVLRLGHQVWFAATSATQAQVEDQTRRIHAMCDEVNRKACEIADANILLAERDAGLSQRIEELEERFRQAELKLADAESVGRTQRERADKAEARLEARDEVFRTFEARFSGTASASGPASDTASLSTISGPATSTPLSTSVGRLTPDGRSAQEEGAEPSPARDNVSECRVGSTAQIPIVAADAKEVTGGVEHGDPKVRSLGDGQMDLIDAIAASAVSSADAKTASEGSENKPDMRLPMTKNCSGITESATASEKADPMNGNVSNSDTKNDGRSPSSPSEVFSGKAIVPAVGGAAAPLPRSADLSTPKIADGGTKFGSSAHLARPTGESFEPPRFQRKDLPHRALGTASVADRDKPYGERTEPQFNTLSST
ncbi:hypothetical protein N7I30_15285 [Aurantimonas litoralis]|nr:hypothetical protein [Aurantimonas litoralis]